MNYHLFLFFPYPNSGIFPISVCLTLLVVAMVVWWVLWLIGGFRKAIPSGQDLIGQWQIYGTLDAP